MLVVLLHPQANCDWILQVRSSRSVVSTAGNSTICCPNSSETSQTPRTLACHCRNPTSAFRLPHATGLFQTKLTHGEPSIRHSAARRFPLQGSFRLQQLILMTCSCLRHAMPSSPAHHTATAAAPNSSSPWTAAQIDYLLQMLAVSWTGRVSHMSGGAPHQRLQMLCHS